MFDDKIMSNIISSYNTKEKFYQLIAKYVDFVNCNSCKRVNFKCKRLMIHVIIYINARLWADNQCINLAEFPKMTLHFLLKLFQFL